MSQGVRTIIIPVHDLGAAAALYTAVLGVAPYADEPFYVGFRIGDQEIGLDPHGHHHGMTQPLGYCHVDDVTTALQGALDLGCRVRQNVKQVGSGRYAAVVEDPSGNALGLLQC